MPHGALSEQLWHLHHQCWKALLDEAYARQRQQKLSAATQRRKNRVANLSQIEMDRQNQQRNRLVLSVLAPQTILVNALNNGRDKSVQQEAKQIRQSVEQELSDLEEASLESANKHRAALSTIQDVLSTLDELGL